MNTTERQIGGDHYKGIREEYQLAQYCTRNPMPWCIMCVLKYVTRYRRESGGGLQDLEKALHYVELHVEELPHIQFHARPGMPSLGSLNNFCSANHLDDPESEVVHSAVYGAYSEAELRKTRTHILEVAANYDREKTGT